MGFVTFEDIEAWQEARVLTQLIRRVCKTAPAKYDRVWVDQITRSCLSIMANIAEGHDAQSDAEFTMFLGYAKRSAAETRSHLYFALDESYLTEDMYRDMHMRTKKIAAQLAKLIAYLRNSKRKVRISATSDKPTSD